MERAGHPGGDLLAATVTLPLLSTRLCPRHYGEAGGSVWSPMRDLAVELVEFVDDVVDELGSRKEVGYVQTIMREGTGADRQLAIHQASGGDPRAVVEQVTDETLIGVPLPA
jgi:hypothetical protein